MHKNNVRRRRLESNLRETVRIASIVQKVVETGRSSYVEMRSLARLTGQNVRTRSRSLRLLSKGDDGLAAIIASLPEVMSEGYPNVVMPNGTIREDRLDGLLSIDSEIVNCLGIIESELKDGKTSKAAETLKELVEERKKFVAALRA